MKVLLIEPSHDDRGRGNTVTVERWAKGLKTAGWSVRRVQPFSVAQVAAEDRPDILHAHHAGHCGPMGLETARRSGLPFLVSIGGTDIFGPHGRPAREALEPFAAADGVLGPFLHFRDRLTATIPDLAPYFVVRRGVADADLLPMRARDGRIKALMLGAVRAVKGVLLAVQWAIELNRRGCPFDLDIVGAAADAAYASEVDRAIVGLPFVKRHGGVPPERIETVFRETDFLLNFSESEGSANAILEAWAYGRPVAVRRAPGNQEMLEPAPPAAGFLFDTDAAGLDTFMRRLADFAAEPDAIRDRNARVTQAYVRAHHDTADEIRDLLRAYEVILSRRNS